MNQLESTCLLRNISHVLDRVVSDLSKNDDNLPATIVSIVRLNTLIGVIDALIDGDCEEGDDAQKGDME